jgi:DNA sulfur modification protein DndD
MIFKSIKLRNFRQYKSEIQFDFSVPKDGKETVTLFIAANGVGKTTLLQAVRYCFYGSSQYLNLPQPNELINNQIIESMKEGEVEKLLVEVSFEHSGIEYLARREKAYNKQNNQLRSFTDDIFELSYLTEKSAWKQFPQDKAMDTLRLVLPEGLSQVFMFDGERMERSISDREFSKELRNSILGILGIHKYDKLINIIGSYGKTTSVIGQLNSRKKADTQEAKETRRATEKFYADKENLTEELRNINEKLDDIKKKIDLTKDEQTKIEQIRDLSLKRNKILNHNETLEREIKDLAKEYIKDSKEAIIYKSLLRHHSKFNAFISKDNDTNKFFDSLHVNTINDIQQRKLCICGRPVDEHSDEFHYLENLKDSSLPISTSLYMTRINEKFKKAVDYDLIKKNLDKMYTSLKLKKKEKEDNEVSINVLEDKISKIEKQLGISSQSEIEFLMETRDKLNNRKGQIQDRLGLIDNKLDNLKKQIDRYESHDIQNQKINKVIGTIENINEILKSDKEAKDKIARDTLSKHFNQSLSDVMSGKYEVNISPEYNIEITDLINEIDVTTALSTGQNVVVSISFIDALIKTARDMATEINKDEKYGVLMDAALSNLDETHIERLCRINLNKMDQLVFLSFKRQLRNEMFNGIRSQIGKAYHLTKSDSDGVKYREIAINELDNYIHQIEETE